MTTLIKVTEQYRCGNQKEAQNLIQEAKKNSDYTVIKSSSEVKERKKTEEEWIRVILVKEFCKEIEPEGRLLPFYQDRGALSYDY